ncbi:MAG: hypothetical protein IKN43_07915 [Selenomonadaceae bacterium]|nr:hypothetical protein [Selenomonadaceae bacterium]
MKGIIESLPKDKRLVYDYDLLEGKYLGFYRKNVGEYVNIEPLRQIVSNRPALMLCSGKTLVDGGEALL